MSTATAARRARELLHAYQIDVPPVPVEDIATSLGAQIVHERLDVEISGLLLRENGAALIAVNAQHHPHRRRFTIAHEIGHMQMHDGEYIVDSTVRVNRRDAASSMATDREEMDANAFAAELLMPADLVKTALSQLNTSQVRSHAKVVAVLAEQFAVSSEAIGYRLINLGLSS